MTPSESNPSKSATNTSNSFSNSKAHPAATEPSPSRTTAPHAPTPLHNDLTVAVRHKPNHEDSVRFLRNALFALRQNFLSIPPTSIHVWIETNERTALYHTDNMVSAMAACEAADVTYHVVEETWNSHHVHHIRESCPTSYLLSLSSQWYLHRQLSVVALDEFFKQNPAFIYLRFTHAPRELTRPIRSSGKEWTIDRIDPESEDYFTEAPHIYCLPCLRRHIYAKTLPTHVPNGNWPQFENNMLQLAKSRKAPFELGVTRDSFFCPITHPSLGELPNFPSSRRSA